MNGFINAERGEQGTDFYQGPVAHLMVVAHFVEKSTRQQLAEQARDRKPVAAHDSVMVLLGAGDCCPGELAAALGISKQACSRTIREMESHGLLERRKNPQDSRSTVLSLSKEGARRQRARAHAASAAYQQLADAVGTGRLQQLVCILDKLHSQLVLEPSGSRATAPLPAKQGTAPAHLDRLLPALVHHFRQRLMTALRDKGFAGLRLSFGEVLGLLNRQERRIQYIASVVGVSKQAIAATAVDLEQSGYITRHTDTADRRQVILRLTPQGKRLLSEATASVRALEGSLRSLLGNDEFRKMDDTLAQMYLQVAEHYDASSVLPAKIQQISDKLLAELGVAGVRSLTKHLMTITRGET